MNRPILLLCALAACGQPAAAPANPSTALILADSVHVVDALAREPMVVEHPTGTLFASGYGQPGPKLWQSKDDGAHWSRVAVGTDADGAVGNSDVDLAVGPEGTVYFVTMGYDREVFEGTHVAIGVSQDVGATWTWTRLSTTRFDDRPWVEVAPDGTAHVIWNDGQGVRHVVGHNRGTTWSERARIHPQGGSSHLAIGPRGELAVRIVPLSASGDKIDRDVDLIAVSEDGGLTWTKTPAPGTREWGFPLGNPADLPRWVEPLAWDPDGALYSLWSERNRLVLGRSSDHGATWQQWPVVTDTKLLYYPYLVAGGPGLVGATWFSGQGDSLTAHAARISVPAGADGSPTVIQATSFVPDSWRGWEKTTTPPLRDPDGEYLALAFLQNGDLAVVSPIQNPTADRFGFSWWRFQAR